MENQAAYEAVAVAVRKVVEQGKQPKLVRLGHGQCLALASLIAPNDTIEIDVTGADAAERLTLPVERTGQHDYLQIVTR